MKKVFSYLKKYRKEAILAPLFKMLEASFELFVPLVMAALIDEGINGSDRSLVVRSGIILVALAAIGLVCAVTAQYFSAKAAVGMAAELKHAIFAHIQKLSFTKLDEIGSSTLITRITSDVNQIQTGVNLSLRLLLRSPFIVFGAMIMAFTVDVKSALVFVVAIPLLCVVVFGVMLATIPRFKRAQAGLDKLLRTTRENFTGVRVIRAFNLEEHEKQRFAEENDDLLAIQNATGRISAMMNPVTFVIVNASLLVIIRTGALQVDRGIITQGEVIALVNYMSQILVELVKMANLIITITKSVACAQRVSSVLDIPTDDGYVLAEEKMMAASLAEASSGAGASGAGASEANNPEANSENADGKPDYISFSDVSFRYEGAGDYTLKDISFSVDRGDTIGIIGGTGSGKTSLIDLIAGFYPVTEGELSIDGRNINSMSREETHERVAVVMQGLTLFKGTIRSNVCFGREEATDEEVIEALKVAQAYDFVSRKENGIMEEVTAGGTNFSGGQRQRIAIARAICKNPDILILDDSSSALDYATDRALREAIKKLPGEHTTFIVSQRTASVQHADRIIVLDDGRAVGIGTHEQLLESCDIYREIYESQLGLR